jgi:antitoxin component YwqK of YwqJK toxin-antitoxin module
MHKIIRKRNKKSMTDDLKLLKNACTKYTKISNDDGFDSLSSKYVYKKCIDHTNKSIQCLVILEKLDVTITNENREYVTNARYASFRADKLKVVAIININDVLNTRPCLLTSFRINYISVMTIYEVGKTVHSNFFDNELNNVHSGGIHYFKTIEPAYFYSKNFQEKYTGQYHCWSDNGSLICEGHYANGFRSGLWTYFYSDGKKLSEGSYIDNEQSGEWVFWHNNGVTESVGEYSVGKKQGKWIYRHRNSKISSRGHYVNDDEKGLWVFWHENGKKSCEGLYLNGEPVGIWKHWYSNGKKQKTGEYIKGERAGVWTFWNTSGYKSTADYRIKNKSNKILR